MYASEGCARQVYVWCFCRQGPRVEDLEVGDDAAAASYRGGLRVATIVVWGALDAITVYCIAKLEQAVPHAANCSSHSSTVKAYTHLNGNALLPTNPKGYSHRQVTNRRE